MKARITLLTVLCLLLSAPLYAQTAARLEALLLEPEINWSSAAAFVLEAADSTVSTEAATSESPFTVALEKNWLPKNAEEGGAARLNGVALLLMRSFDLKGGIFFRLAKSPHHAYRELVYRGVIRGRADPDMPVSGRDLLLMINRIFTLLEKEQSA